MVTRRLARRAIRSHAPLNYDSLTMLDLKNLEALVATFLSGSLTKAAADSGVPKATLSRHIANAERDVGTQLFHREARRLVPTKAGEIYLRHCEALLLDFRLRLDEVHAEVTNALGAISGDLSVLADSAFATAYVSHVITRYARRHPNVRCHLRVIQESDSPDLFKADCYVCSRPPRGANIVARPLGRFNFSLVAHPSYLQAFGTPETPEDIVRHRIVVFEGSDHPPTSMVLNATSGSRTVQVKPHMTTNNFFVMKAFCTAGLGLAMLPEYFIDSEVRSGALVPVLQSWRPSPMKVHCAYKKQRPLSDKLRALFDLMDQDLVNIRYPPGVNWLR